MKLTALTYQEDDIIVAQCLENGVTSQGDTMEEAIGNLKEATKLYLEEIEVIIERRNINISFFDIDYEQKNQ